MPVDIRNEAELVAKVGKTPAAIALKVIDHLDASARRWLETSTLAALAFGHTESGSPRRGVSITLAGGPAGFIDSEEAALRLPLAALDSLAFLDTDGAGQQAAPINFGGLFFSPGLGETLRVNGRVQQDGSDLLTLQVEECYLHCAKALIRSDFWQGQAEPPAVDTPLLTSPFMLLATMNASGEIDVSPKGDPAGLLLQHTDSGVCFADRPGNRRMDGLKNILTQPQVAIAALYPGCCRVTRVVGAARISADEVLCQRFAVQSRRPTLVVCVDGAELESGHSPALEVAGLWPVPVPAADIDAAAVFAAHVRLNKTRGLAAALARRATSARLMKQGLKHDYRKHLY